MNTKEELNLITDKLNKLHDDIFTKVVIDWKKASVELYFKICAYPNEPKIGETRVILLENFNSFSITRKNEWGESIYVNEADITISNNLYHLEIEIQSGDLIIVEAENVTVKIT